MRESTGEEERADVPVRLPLRSFHLQDAQATTIPYRLDDYLMLVDWTGRAIRSDKRGFIDHRPADHATFEHRC